MIVTENPKRMLVVGGVAAGATATARLRRLDESAEITILDVTTFGEVPRAPLKDALDIPPDKISDGLAEVPKERIIDILSKDGILGHTKLQILKANGWNRVFNIAGGSMAAQWTHGWCFHASLD